MFCSTAVPDSDNNVLFAHNTLKKRAFRTQHFTAATIPRLTGHGSPPNLESVCSIKLRVFGAKFEGRRWSCIEVSVGTWGPDPVLYKLCAIQNRSFPVRKKSSRNGSGSHVPGNTARHRPPTALKLGSEDSQLSGAYDLQVWW